jgi:hypothetical protein
VDLDERPCGPPTDHPRTGGNEGQGHARCHHLGHGRTEGPRRHHPGGTAIPRAGITGVHPSCDERSRTARTGTRNHRLQQLECRRPVDQRGGRLPDARLVHRAREGPSVLLRCPSQTGQCQGPDPRARRDGGSRSYGNHRPQAGYPPRRQGRCRWQAHVVGAGWRVVGHDLLQHRDRPATHVSEPEIGRLDGRSPQRACCEKTFQPCPRCLDDQPQGFRFPQGHHAR